MFVVRPRQKSQNCCEPGVGVSLFSVHGRPVESLPVVSCLRPTTGCVESRQVTESSNSPDTQQTVSSSNQGLMQGHTSAHHDTATHHMTLPCIT